MILARDDQILQIDRTVEFLIAVYDKNGRDIVILSCLGYQRTHGFLHRKMILDHDIVGGHPASDFFLIERIDHLDIMSRFIIQ